MVDARDTGRQFDTGDDLVALESSGSNEPCAFGNDKTRFDGLVRGNEDGVNPQASVGPVLFVEHNPGTVKSGAIDALYRFRKDDRREVLAALEGFVPNRDDGICVLSDHNRFGNEDFSCGARIESHFCCQKRFVHGVMDVLILCLLRVNGKCGDQRYHTQRRPLE